MASEKSASALTRLKKNQEEKLELEQELLITHDKLQTLYQKKRKCSDQYNILVEEYAQESCKQLTDMMHTMLPLELRQLIYGYLYIEDGSIPVGSYHFTTYMPKGLRDNKGVTQTHSRPVVAVAADSTLHDHSVCRDENLVYPDSWLLNPCYIGSNVAFEALRFYYEHNTFSICTIGTSGWRFLIDDPLLKFAKSEQIGTKAQANLSPPNVIPMDCIRNLEVRIKHEHYTTYSSFYDDQYDEERDLTGEQELLLELFDILKNLSAAIKAREKANELNVEFCIMTAYDPHVEHEGPIRPNFPALYARHHVNLLEAIRIPIYQLKFTPGVQLKVVHYDEKWMAFPREITAIFHLTQEQWQQEQNAYHARAVELGNPSADYIYSPREFHVHEPDQDQDSEGYPFEFVTKLAQNRWGLQTVFHRKCEIPIVENDYWPLRRSGNWERGPSDAIYMQDGDERWQCFRLEDLPR